jgi:hypothetical protein
VAIVASYVVGAHLLYADFGYWPKNAIPFSPTGDQVQQVWYLAWAAHAFAHAGNPLFSNAINFPFGLNLVTNTAEPLLALLLAPLTLLAGPTVAYIIGLQLGFAASALSAAVASRRAGLSLGASWFVGATFGFCAHRVVEGNVDLFLTFDVILPWICLAALRLHQQGWSPRRFGLTVGGLMALEFGISTERVGLEALVLLLALLASVVVRRDHEAVTEWATGLGIAVVAFAIVASVQLWYFFEGPQSIHGIPHKHVAWQNVSLGGLIRPGAYAWWAPFGRTAQPAFAAVVGNWVNAAYLGVPLIILAIIGVVVNRYEPEGLGVFIVGVVALLLSFGPTIYAFGLKIPGPYRLLRDIPVARDILPLRFSEVVALAAAFLAGLAIDAVPWDDLWRWSIPAAIGVVVLAGATVVSLIPSAPIPAAKNVSSPFFLSSDVAAALPSGTAVLSYPYPIVLFDSAMLDQAQSGVWYKLIGGQGIAPNSSGGNQGIRPLTPIAVFDVLYRCAQADPTAPITTLGFTVPPLPPNNAATAELFQQFVRNHSVQEVLWENWGYHPQLALSYLTAAFGAGHHYDNGNVIVWPIKSPLSSSTG